MYCSTYIHKGACDINYLNIVVLQDISTMNKQVSFYVSKELWKEFHKKCIDKDRSRSKVLAELIKEFLNKP